MNKINAMINAYEKFVNLKKRASDEDDDSEKVNILAIEPVDLTKYDTLVANLDGLLAIIKEENDDEVGSLVQYLKSEVESLGETYSHISSCIEHLKNIKKTENTIMSLAESNVDQLKGFLEKFTKDRHEFVGEPPLNELKDSLKEAASQFNTEIDINKIIVLYVEARKAFEARPKSAFGKNDRYLDTEDIIVLVKKILQLFPADKSTSDPTKAKIVPVITKIVTSAFPEKTSDEDFAQVSEFVKLRSKTLGVLSDELDDVVDKAGKLTNLYLSKSERIRDTIDKLNDIDSSYLDTEMDGQTIYDLIDEVILFEMLESVENIHKGVILLSADLVKAGSDVTTFDAMTEADESTVMKGDVEKLKEKAYEKSKTQSKSSLEHWKRLKESKIAMQIHRNRVKQVYEMHRKDLGRFDNPRTKSLVAKLEHWNEKYKEIYKSKKLYLQYKDIDPALARQHGKLWLEYIERVRRNSAKFEQNISKEFTNISSLSPDEQILVQSQRDYFKYKDVDQNKAKILGRAWLEFSQAYKEEEGPTISGFHQGKKEKPIIIEPAKERVIKKSPYNLEHQIQGAIALTGSQVRTLLNPAHGQIPKEFKDTIQLLKEFHNKLPDTRKIGSLGRLLKLEPGTNFTVTEKQMKEIKDSNRELLTDVFIDIKSDMEAIKKIKILIGNNDIGQAIAVAKNLNNEIKRRITRETMEPSETPEQDFYKFFYDFRNYEEILTTAKGQKFLSDLQQAYFNLSTPKTLSAFLKYFEPEAQEERKQKGIFVDPYSDQPDVKGINNPVAKALLGHIGRTNPLAKYDLVRKLNLMYIISLIEAVKINYASDPKIEEISRELYNNKSKHEVAIAFQNFLRQTQPSAYDQYKKYENANNLRGALREVFDLPRALTLNYLSSTFAKSTKANLVQMPLEEPEFQPTKQKIDPIDLGEFLKRKTSKRYLTTLLKLANKFSKFIR